MQLHQAFIPVADAGTQSSPGCTAGASSTKQKQCTQTPTMKDQAVSPLSSKVYHSAGHARHDISSLRAPGSTSDAACEAMCMASLAESAPAPRKQIPSPTVSPVSSRTKSMPQSPRLCHAQAGRSPSPTLLKCQSPVQHVCSHGQKQCVSRQPNMQTRKARDVHRHADCLEEKHKVSRLGLSAAALGSPPMGVSRSHPVSWSSPKRLTPGTCENVFHFVPTPRSRSMGYVCDSKSDRFIAALAPRLNGTQSVPAAASVKRTAISLPPSPLSAYASAKRFGPIGSPLQASPCCMVPSLISARHSTQLHVEQPRWSPMCQSDEHLNYGRRPCLRHTHGSPDQSDRPTAKLSPSLSPRRESLNPDPARPLKPHRRSTCSRHQRGACTRGTKSIAQQAVVSSDDSSSGSPVSRAASIWGCNALERALRQVENTLGRTSLKQSTRIPGRRSPEQRRPGVMTSTRPCNQMTGHARLHRSSSILGTQAGKGARGDSREVPVSGRGRMRLPARPAAACSKGALDGGSCSVRNYEDMQDPSSGFRCTLAPGRPGVAGCDAPWADEPGVYNLEAAALRQAAQSFFRKQRCEASEHCIHAKCMHCAYLASTFSTHEGIGRCYRVCCW
eukprot:jgi/Ulvmu1/6204/UM028_0060.1